MHWEEGSLTLVLVWAKAGLFWVLNTISSHLLLLLFTFIKQMLAITIEYLQYARFCSKGLITLILTKCLRNRLFYCSYLIEKTQAQRN